MTDLLLLNALRHGSHAGHDVVDQASLRVRRHQAEQAASLRVIVIALAMIMPAYFTGEREERLFVLRIFDRAAETIRLIVRTESAVVVEPGRPIAMIGVYRAGLRTIHRQRVVVHAQAITMSIRVGQNTRLKHLVG